MSEIRIMSFNFAPVGWAQCNGQFLPINQNQALFALLGTTYGGNGQTTFALPDLRGRVPIHIGNGLLQGTSTGESAHTVTQSELPTHTHVSTVDNSAATANIATNGASRLANSTPANGYAPLSSPVAMDAASIGNTGGSQPHNNMMPSLTLMFCIALQGIFPSQN
jgi:microcystin-dependent protein